MNNKENIEQLASAFDDAIINITDDNEFSEISKKQVGLYYPTLDRYLISTSLVISSYDDGYYITRGSDYLAASYFRMNEADKVNHAEFDMLKSQFIKMVTDIYLVTIDLRYAEIQEIMLKHQKAVEHIHVAFPTNILKQQIDSQNALSKFYKNVWESC